MSVQSSVQARVMVLALANPPVNGLGLATRRGVVEGLAAALADSAIDAIVLIGQGKVFSGGADIREFDAPEALAEPSLPEVIAALDASTKPVVAAVHGIALGGGLELALGAHYRVFARGTQIGLPEVKLGLLPGAGGTQRLARAIGVAAALKLIVSGQAVAVETLAGTALVDQVVEAELLPAAISFAQQVAATGGVLPRLRDRVIEEPALTDLVNSARQQLGAAAQHYPAPLRCIEAVSAAATASFDAGLALEGQAFIELMQGHVSRALRHGFFAERAASKVADIGPEVATRAVNTVGVIGAGTMGSGIAMNFLNAGVGVCMLENNSAALERGVATIQSNYSASVHKGKLDAATMASRMALLKPTLEYADLAQADLIIEAVFEDYVVKQAVFERLDAIARPGAILASNTSTLDLDRIAAFTSRPSEVLGMHFFSPANVMKLLELVRGRETSKDVLNTALAVSRRIGKTAVVAGVCDGFIGNRMIEQYARQAGFLLDEGASPQQVDQAAENFGFAMGPFRMGDLAGNDIGWAIRKRRYRERPEMVYSRTADLLCELGRFGQKTGGGWYDYRPGDRNAQPSAVVAAMLAEHSASLGLQPRQISDEEIVERLVYALVNEGALLLAEGIAAKASDIDVVYLSGYGFPAFRGGPMFYADSVGLTHVLAAIKRFAAGYRGEAWTPAPLLERLAAEGRRFNA